MPSLTRIEAEARADLLTVRHYDLSLDLTGSDVEFASASVIDFECRTPGSSSFLDVQAASIIGIELNGRPLDPATITDGRLPLTDLAAQNRLTIRSVMTYSTDGEGLHQHVDPADGRTYLYAMSFLDAAPRWFACFDQPDLKARYRIEVTTPTDWTVVGNGAATVGEPGRWTLAETEPLSTYFVTLVAGPYHSVRAEHDGIPLGLHVRASLSEHLDAQAEELFTVTRQGLDEYHRLFGVRYPWGEYHQAFVPDFNAGAMENPGCVTFRDSFIFRTAATRGERGGRARTVTHEMAHMWFGDLVTMRWWDDLWLNESFAEYLAHRVCADATDFNEAWAEFGIKRKDWGSIADQAPSTHPVAGNGAADAAAALNDFDGISYAKGASVLKQLVAFVGDEVFLAGLRRYFDRHRFGNAEFADLIDAWTAAGAHDLHRWARAWLQTSGLDTLVADLDATDAGKPVVTIRRDSAGSANRTHSVQVAGFDRAGRSAFRRPTRITDNWTSFEVSDDVDDPGSVAVVVADADDDTWARIRVGGADGWTRIAGVLPALTDELARVVLYNTVRDAVRDAELDPAAALDLIAAALPTESDDLVLAEVFDFGVATLAGPFCAPSQRRARSQRLADLAAELLANSTVGSDAQLAAARGLIAATTDAGLLQSWLVGASRPTELELDAELRWAVVRRLAALGGIEPDGIEAEFSRDHSASGQVHRAYALAVRPDAGAKAAAWDRLTTANEATNYELFATARGFFAADQNELTANYVERFFTELPANAAGRRGWTLGQVIALGYPLAHSDPDTLALAVSTIAAAELEPRVRRSLVDGTDQLRRAVDSITAFGPR